MDIPRDENKILSNIPENQFKVFLANPLAKSYKNYLENLYLDFHCELKRNDIPKQPELMSIITQYGPFSIRIDKHMRQNKQLAGENQRIMLGKCFVKIFLPNTTWKNDQGLTLLDLYEQFRKQRLSNTIPPPISNPDDPQQSMLLEQCDSISNDTSSYVSLNQQNESKVSQEIFQSFIRDDSNRNDQFVDIPLSASKINNNSSKAQSTQVEEIAKENFSEQLLNRKTKKIRKTNNRHLFVNKVKQQAEQQKREKNGIFETEKGQKPHNSQFQTPFGPNFTPTPNPNPKNQKQCQCQHPVINEQKTLANNAVDNSLQPPERKSISIVSQDVKKQSNAEIFVSIINNKNPSKDEKIDQGNGFKSKYGAPQRKSISILSGSVKQQSENDEFQSMINYPSLPEPYNEAQGKDCRQQVNKSTQHQFNFEDYASRPKQPDPYSSYPQSQGFGYDGYYIHPFLPPIFNPIDYMNHINPISLGFSQPSLPQNSMFPRPFTQIIPSNQNNKVSEISSKIEDIQQLQPQCIQIQKPLKPTLNDIREKKPQDLKPSLNEIRKEKPQLSKPLFEQKACHQITPQLQKISKQMSPFPQQNSHQKKLIFQQIVKFHQKLLTQANSQQNNKTIAKQIHEKYCSKIFNDLNSFRVPLSIEKWTSALKPQQYLSQYLHQAKTKLLQSTPIQPRTPLIIPTLSSETLNQQRYYFSIFQFYDVFESSSEINLHFDSLNQFINVKEIIKMTKQELKRHQRFRKLFGLITTDLFNIGTQTTVNNMMTFACEYFYRHHRPLNESLILNDPTLPMNLKSTQEGFYIFKFIENEHQQKNRHLQVISKDRVHIEFNLRQSQYDSLKKNLPSTIKQLRKLAEQIISETVKVTINHYSRDIEQMRTQVVKNIVKECRNDYKKIGIIPKNLKFHPEQAPFVDITSYEVQPITLHSNEVFESIIEQVSPLLDKERIVQKVMSRTYESRSQKIACSREYILEVKKQYQSTQALKHYSGKKSFLFQQQLKTHSFTNLIVDHIKFDKLLKKFTFSIETYANKANHHELLNYAYDTLVEQLNRLEIQLNLISFTLSKQTKTWFHEFAIGYLIKYIEGMRQAKNQIRKQTIEEVLKMQKQIMGKFMKSLRQNEK